jgi:hypothetical protein
MKEGARVQASHGKEESPVERMGRSLALRRSNLRDVVLVLCCISVYFFSLSPVRIAISLVLL